MALDRTQAVSSFVSENALSRARCGGQGCVFFHVAAGAAALSFHVVMNGSEPLRRSLTAREDVKCETQVARAIEAMALRSERGRSAGSQVGEGRRAKLLAGKLSGPQGAADPARRGDEPTNRGGILCLRTPRAVRLARLLTVA